MTEGGDRAGRRTVVRRKTAEIATGVFFLLVGAIVVWDSVRLGLRWGAEGPQAGYFPFYIALIVIGCTLVNLWRALRSGAEGDRPFVEAGQLKSVMTVLVPTVVYAALIKWIGIYVASALFVGYFMRRLGGYSWPKVVAVSAGLMVALFLLFDIWFGVPLPKGPIETALRLN